MLFVCGRNTINTPLSKANLFSINSQKGYHIAEMSTIRRGWQKNINKSESKMSSPWSYFNLQEISLNGWHLCNAIFCSRQLQSYLCAYTNLFMKTRVLMCTSIFHWACCQITKQCGWSAAELSSLRSLKNLLNGTYLNKYYLYDACTVLRGGPLRIEFCWWWMLMLVSTTLAISVLFALNNS